MKKLSFSRIPKFPKEIGIAKNSLSDEKTMLESIQLFSTTPDGVLFLVFSKNMNLLREFLKHTRRVIRRNNFKKLLLPFYRLVDKKFSYPAKPLNIENQALKDLYTVLSLNLEYQKAFELSQLRIPSNILEIEKEMKLRRTELLNKYSGLSN